MKDLLQQQEVEETQSHWKTVIQTSHSKRQLASMKMHWRTRTEQSPEEGHKQGMFRNFLEKLGPILMWGWLCGWLCGNKNSLRSQARWRLGPVVLGNEGRGQGTPRQRDLGPSETTNRQGRHTGQMGLQIEIGTQWSSRQIQSTLCGEGLQTSGRTGLLWDFCAYL